MERLIPQVVPRPKLRGNRNDQIAPSIVQNAMLPLLLALQVASTPSASDALAIVNIQQVLAESTVGKAFAAKVSAYRTDKGKAIAERQAAVEAAVQQGLPEANIRRMRLDLQRVAEDVDADVTAFARSVQDDFANRLRPVLQKILEEDHLGIILEVPNPIVVWAHPSLDVTSKAIKLLDASPVPDKK